MSRLSVLVVDDERISRLTTTQQLRDVGYDADMAENAYAALEMLAKNPFDVVLTDLRMPKMDAWRFCGNCGAGQQTLKSFS